MNARAKSSTVTFRCCQLFDEVLGNVCFESFKRISQFISPS